MCRFSFGLVEGGGHRGLGGSSRHPAGGVGRADDGEGCAAGEGIADEVEEPAIGLDWNDIEGNEDRGVYGGTDDIFIVSVENAQVILLAVVGGGGDDLEALSEKPSVDFRLGNGDQIEPRLGSADGEVVFLREDALKPVDPGNKDVLEAESLKVVQGRCFPKVEAAGVLIGGNQRQINSRCKTENAAARDFEETISLCEDVVLLPAANEAGGDIRSI